MRLYKSFLVSVSGGSTLFTYINGNLFVKMYTHKILTQSLIKYSLFLPVVMGVKAILQQVVYKGWPF